jgi:hypothetical protein
MNSTALIEELTKEINKEVQNHVQLQNLSRLEADPEKVEQGLAKLVLTLIELLRQLMERQAVRRVEAGGLTDEEVERMGDTFMRLEERMQQLKIIFGLENEELNLNLGPLGNLL